MPFQAKRATSNSSRSLLEMRSACAKSAALDDDEMGYVAQTERRPGSLLRKEKTRFHCDELGPRSAAKDTFHVCPACSSTRQAMSSAPGQRLKARAEIARDGPGLAGSDDPAIQLADRDDLGGGTGEEGLIRGVDVVAVEHRLLHLIARLHRQLQNGVPGHSFEQTGKWWRGAQLSLFHYKNVLPRSLGHGTRAVQHDHLVGAGADAFHLGENVRQIVERFDPGRQGLPLRNGRACGDDRKSGLVDVLRPKLDGVHDDHHRGLGALARIEPQIPRAPGYHMANVRLGDPGAANRLFRYGRQLVAGLWDGEQDRLGRIVQPVQVVLQAEDLATIHPDPLENSIAVQQAMVVDRDHRGAPVTPLAVEPDDWRAGALAGCGHGWLGADGHEGNVKAQSSVASPQIPVASRQSSVVSWGLRTGDWRLISMPL